MQAGTRARSLGDAALFEYVMEALIDRAVVQAATTLIQEQRRVRRAGVCRRRSTYRESAPAVDVLKGTQRALWNFPWAMYSRVSSRWKSARFKAIASPILRPKLALSENQEVAD